MFEVRFQRIAACWLLFGSLLVQWNQVHADASMPEVDAEESPGHVQRDGVRWDLGQAMAQMAGSPGNGLSRATCLVIELIEQKLLPAGFLFGTESSESTSVQNEIRLPRYALATGLPMSPNTSLVILILFLICVLSSMGLLYICEYHNSA